MLWKQSVCSVLQEVQVIHRSLPNGTFHKPAAHTMTLSSLHGTLYALKATQDNVQAQFPYRRVYPTNIVATNESD